MSTSKMIACVYVLGNHNRNFKQNTKLSIRLNYIYIAQHAGIIPLLLLLLLISESFYTFMLIRIYTESDIRYGYNSLRLGIHPYCKAEK